MVKIQRETEEPENARLANERFPFSGNRKPVSLANAYGHGGPLSSEGRYSLFGVAVNGAKYKTLKDAGDSVL